MHKNLDLGVLFDVDYDFDNPKVIQGRTPEVWPEVALKTE